MKVLGIKQIALSFFSSVALLLICTAANAYPHRAGTTVYLNENNVPIGQTLIMCSGQNFHGGEIAATNSRIITVEYGCGDQIQVQSGITGHTRCIKIDYDVVVFFPEYPGISQDTVCAVIDPICTSDTPLFLNGYGFTFTRGAGD